MSALTVCIHWKLTFHAKADSAGLHCLQIVPEAVRTSVYAFDKSIIMALGAISTPLSGLLAEKVFGATTLSTPKHAKGVALLGHAHYDPVPQALPVWSPCLQGAQGDNPLLGPHLSNLSEALVELHHLLSPTNIALEGPFPATQMLSQATHCLLWKVMV